MARPLKYLVGEPITDPLDAVQEILAGRYVIERGKRQHPSWMRSRQLSQIAALARSGSLRRAIPNPDHPDHKDPS